jgi:hypothetical protein
MYPGGVQIIKKIAKNIISSHDSSEQFPDHFNTKTMCKFEKNHSSLHIEAKNVQKIQIA